MKRCPQCHRVETDETLKFCRADGATLVSDSAPIASEAGTVQLGPDAGEVHTSILPHPTDATFNRVTGPTTSLPQASNGTTRELAKPRISGARRDEARDGAIAQRNQQRLNPKQ